MQACHWPFPAANLPPTLSKSQVNSVRKHMKMQLLNLLKQPASYDSHRNICTLLTDLGASQSEVTAPARCSTTVVRTEPYS